MRIPRSTYLLTCLLAFTRLVISAAEDAPLTPLYGKLQSDDPNYFVLAYPNDSGDLEGDESHVEFYLSVKYPFDLHGDEHWWRPNVLAIVYNGLYDFYMIPGNRYESAPIISRRQNPGAALEWFLGKNDTLRLSYFHESNGQSIDRQDGLTAYNHEKNQGGEDYALAQISRGWDYVGLRTAHEQGERWKWMTHIELRQYLHRQGFGTSTMEDDIFWDPADDSKIQDYDGLRFTYEQHMPLDLSARLELKTGTSEWRTLENVGGKISLSWKVFHVFYFKGYGKEPASYHLESQYAGFGIEFR